MMTSTLFGILAFFGLFVAMMGHAAKSTSVAPSMYVNNISLPGYIMFAICGLMSVAAYFDAGAK